jgi:ubiquinone/menaquinone biosynthesis C-methylase UbiE
VTLSLFLRLAVGAVLIGFMIRQCRRPFGWLGRSTARSMNARHSSVTDWGLSHITIGESSTILDVGCGGGRTIEKMAAIASQGKVFGVDYSPASLEVARAVNATLIAASRVDIREASVSALPFSDATFDLVTAVETHYYWPNPAADVREIVRVLKPGGRVLVIAETYAGGWMSALTRPVMAMLGGRSWTLDQHRAWFEAAGLLQVSVDSVPAKNWMCVVGTKPTTSPSIT